MAGEGRIMAREGTGGWEGARRDGAAERASSLEVIGTGVCSQFCRMKGIKG